jgi:tryptophan synthase beta chain
MKKGKFGKYGGQFAPEILMPALEELQEEFSRYRQDADFKKELDYLLSEFGGRKTPLYRAKNLSKELGINLYLKREDLVHGGAHKLNNTLGQVLLAKKMGKKRVIAETGAGQHGVATAIASAALGLKCEVFMGTEDIERQKLNVFKMELLGTEVIPVTSGSETLKDATNEAMRDWLANVYDTYYCIGSVVGPHPYPTIVREFQRVIGQEIKSQIQEKEGRMPDALVACVGGGSNAMGTFYDFVQNNETQLIGVEAAGEGVDTPKHGATLSKGRDGVFHGMLSKLLQDEWGQIQISYSISAGLDYPGVGPELSHMASEDRLTLSYATDDEALSAIDLLSTKEGIIPALESAHALAHVVKNKEELADKLVVVTVSGRGDKDVFTIAESKGKKI